MPGSSRRGVLVSSAPPVLLCSSWRWRASRWASCSGRLVCRLVPGRLCLCVSLYCLVRCVVVSSRRVVLLFASCGRLVHASRGVLLRGGAVCVGRPVVAGRCLLVVPSRCSVVFIVICLIRIVSSSLSGKASVISASAGCSVRLVGRGVHRGDRRCFLFGYTILGAFCACLCSCIPWRLVVASGVEVVRLVSAERDGVYRLGVLVVINR